MRGIAEEEGSFLLAVPGDARYSFHELGWTLPEVAPTSTALARSKVRWPSSPGGRRAGPTLKVVEMIRMSQLAAPARASETAQLEKLCVSVRGKLQFMDYLVRAAVADVDRFKEETDAGTRIFLRQLIEMHASNLTVECENMRLVGELCNTLDTTVSPAASLRNGEVV